MAVDDDIFKYLICKLPEQRAAVEKLNLQSVQHLFDAVMSSTQPAKAHPKRLVVSKARLVNFVNAHCCKAFLDFASMKRMGLIVIAGKFPRQTVTLRSEAPRVTPPAHIARPSYSKHFALNGFLSEDTALAKAIRLSLATKTNTKMTAPQELCCPMTLKLFEDPVDTIHGMTYEREAVTTWLKTNNTDPITNDVLLVTTVWPNELMRQRVRQFVDIDSCH